MNVRRTHPSRNLGKYIYPGLIILACLIFGCVLGFLIGCARIPGDLVIVPPLSSIVYDCNGDEVGRYFADENREQVPLSDIPQVMRDAVVAVEDPRFYEHFGVDIWAILRAGWTDIRGGGYTQGGSTITQQLAKNAFLTQRKEITRKIREAFYAIALERKYSKDQILEFYLNEICFGHGAYGIERAAKTYFQKSAKDLSLTEAALLAGMIRSPGMYDPYSEPEAATGRRSFVLKKMVEHNYITQAQADAADDKPLGVLPIKSQPRKAAYFMEFVQRQLADKFSTEELDKAGLRIYTTLDNKIQSAAEDMLTVLPKGKPDANGVLQPQVALVAVDPETGCIKAMIGGRDYGNTQFNRADRALRQPGSTMKPFAYTAAIDSREFTPSSILIDAPVTFPQPDGTDWSPRNYDRTFRGAITLQEALEQSVNVITAQLVDTLGPAKVASYARKMGLTDLVLSGQVNDLALAPLALGGLTRGVTPLELATAYTPLANRGIRSDPIAILKVVDSHGNVLYEKKSSTKESVLSPATAYVMTNILRRVVTGAHGTGHNAYIDEYHPVAGKTGTTSDNTNAWFVGWTPGLLACVWLGNDVQSQPLPFTSAMAATCWGKFMKEAVKTLPRGNFTAPPGVTAEIPICKASGELFSDSCPPEDLDYAVYLEGTEPTTYCSVHKKNLFENLFGGSSGSGTTPSSPAEGQNDQQTNNADDGDYVQVKICKESGAKANIYCPPEDVEVRTYKRGEEPTEYCTLHGPWTQSSAPTPSPPPTTSP